MENGSTPIQPTPASTPQADATNNGKDKAPAQAVSAEQLAATQAELAATKAALDEIKRAQAGESQKVQQLMAQLESTKSTKMSADERIAALERENAEAKAKAERNEWLNAGYKLAQERGLPVMLIDNYGGDKGKVKEYLDAIKKRDDEIRAAEAQKLMASGAKPVGSAPVQNTVDLSRMSKDEKLAYFQAEALKRMPVQN